MAIRVVVAQPGLRAAERIIPNELEYMQELVAGYIEPFNPGFELPYPIQGWCNEEGRLQKLPPNRVFPTVGVVMGPIFMSGGDDENGDVTSIPDEYIRIVEELLDICMLSPESFGGGKGYFAS